MTFCVTQMMVSIKVQLHVSVRLTANNKRAGHEGLKTSYTCRYESFAQGNLNIHKALR